MLVTNNWSNNHAKTGNQLAHDLDIRIESDWVVLKAIRNCSCYDVRDIVKPGLMRLLISEEEEKAQAVLNQDT